MAVVIQTRGKFDETFHPFSVVAVGTDGSTQGIGPARLTPWRSAAKPFQLATSLELLGDPLLSPQQLAVGAASHSAEPVHVELVESLLARFGFTIEQLRCGAHAPMHGSSARAVIQSGQKFSNIHNNCSGKHTFMLAAAAAQGWALDYRPPDHPLQQAILGRVHGWAQTSVDTALDGCGVPTFCLTLAGIAQAWHLLALCMKDDRDPRLGAIGRAMAAHPELTSGTGRFDLQLTKIANESMAVKVGAQGVFCLALPERGLGLAVKVHSGAAEALAAAVVFALQQYAPGSVTVPEEWDPLLVRNVVGAIAGSYKVQAED